MEKNNSMELTVIIPVYNTEEYLSACLESLMRQGNLRLEIILVNDGSTDRSGEIAEQYARRDSRIKILHQENRGASAARNAGLEVAQGEYIAFVDSDDWIKEDSLYELYHKAVRCQADVLTGRLRYCNQDGSIGNSSRQVDEDILNIPLSGKECFNRLVATLSYLPMPVMYIYSRDYLKNIQARFEEGIMHEDELWTPLILCQAAKVIVVDLEFYYYRMHEKSVSHTAKINKRLYSLFRIADRLIEFAGRFTFTGEDRELKNWLYVNIFRIYYCAFTLLPGIKDSTFKLPDHQLEHIWKENREMMPEPQKRCGNYYRIAVAGLEKYTGWRTSVWVASIAPLLKAGKKIMLIFNTIWGEDLPLKIEDVPSGWLVTTDRRYLQMADSVVFHLPDVRQEMECDLEKPQGQIWVAWYLESEENYPWIREPTIAEMFDIKMSYRQDADVVHPYYQYNYIKILKQTVSERAGLNKTCMFISSPFNKSGRMEYIKELMNYTGIDSFGRLYNNKQLPEDNGIETKISEYVKYKFVIAFENAIDEDYVTEKFYDPLIAGSVPVYFGAPNIEEFAPGDHCFVDVRQYDSPKSLAEFINKCFGDDRLYAKFFEWKNKPLRKSFLQKARVQKTNPFIRLCGIVSQRLSVGN